MKQDDTELKTVSRFYTTADADFAQMLLESNGIETYLDGQFINTSNVMYSFADGGIRLMVSSDEYEMACQILKEENITANEPQKDNGNLNPRPLSYRVLKELKHNWLLIMIVFFFLIAFVMP